MAVINFGSKTVSNAQDIADMTAALQANYATNGVPVPTLAQIEVYIREENWRRIQGMVREWRRNQIAVSDPVGT